MSWVYWLTSKQYVPEEVMEFHKKADLQLTGALLPLARWRGLCSKELMYLAIRWQRPEAYQ